MWTADIASEWARNLIVARILVARNSKDFPADVSAGHERQAIDPETFPVGQSELKRRPALRAMRAVRERQGEPPSPASAFPVNLTAKHMPGFAAAPTAHAEGFWTVPNLWP